MELTSTTRGSRRRYTREDMILVYSGREVSNTLLSAALYVCLVSVALL